MPTPPLDVSDEELSRLVALYAQCGDKTSAANAAGLSETTFRRRLNLAAARGLMGYRPVLPGYEVKSVSTKTESGHWVKQTKAPGEVFEMPEGLALKGVTALVDADGRVIQQHIMGRADPLMDRVAALRVVVDELRCELPRIEPTPAPTVCDKFLLNQYTLTDLHFGMLAWGEETRGSNYDLKIAEKLLSDWFSAAISLSPPAAVGVLAQLGDMLHHDSKESVTPMSRHVLDADSRLQRVIRVVIRVWKRIIGSMLEKYPHVHIIMASGNHDDASGAWLRELMHSMYEDEPRITVDNSPDAYYAYEWGHTALFYHHGHKRNVKDIDTVFAGKFRELYGRSHHHYAHIGHLHNDEGRDTNLMKVERHRTLAPADAYASSGGWLSKSDAKVVTYHREFGEVSRLILSPQMVARAA